MRASQDQCININVDQLRQISSGDLIRHGILPQPLFHQWHKQGTGFPVDGNIFVQFLYVFIVHLAADGSLGGNNADTAVAGHFRCGLRSRLDHTNDGNIQFLLQFIQCIGACRIACHHNGLHLKSFQETHNLFGEAGDRFLGLAAIGHSRRISEIYDLLIGNLPHDLPGYGQSADAGIKYTDGGIFFQRSYILLIHGISPSIFLTS